MKVRKILILLVLHFFMMQQIYAFSERQHDSIKQDVKVPLMLGFSYQYGFTMNHNPALRLLNTNHFSTYEISLLRQTIGNSYWEQNSGYPAYGLSFMYSELGNSYYLGRMFGLLSFFNFSFVTWKEKYSIGLQVGLGLAYGTKPYDRFTNYKNIAYGSHINALIRLGLYGNIQIIPKLHLSGGVNFTHMSNGTTKEPNYGINNASVHLGLGYQINDASNTRIVWIEEPRRKYPYRFQIAAYASYKDIDYLDETPVYFTGGLHFNLLKQYRFARSWGVGLELDMDFAQVQILKNKNKFSGDAVSYLIPGIKAIHQFHISRLCLGTELCYMIYHKDNSQGDWYANLSLDYNFNDWLMAGMALRSGFFYADYFGIGLGFKVWEKK